MARAAFQKAGWGCVFANDFDHKKATAYRENWGVRGLCPELRVQDVRALNVEDIPNAELIWGSFPCQDLSLAGAGAGLKGERSGVFYPFWDLVQALVADRRGPTIIALENVIGALTSHNGADFKAICRSFVNAGYQFGALVMDAALFVPQSRPRLFIIGVHADVSIPDTLRSVTPRFPFHTHALCKAVENLPLEVRDMWNWWSIPKPHARASVFSDLIEENPIGVAWHEEGETRALLQMMSSLNRGKVEAAQRTKQRMIGSIYKRTRKENGVKHQRAEVRFDDIVGCLRTPAGGSSRQIIMIVEGEKIRSRLISPRETARLMGLPDQYQLPKRYNEAYHLTGDGVVVPVVEHLIKHLFSIFVEAPRLCESAA